MGRGSSRVRCRLPVSREKINDLLQRSKVEYGQVQRLVAMVLDYNRLKAAVFYDSYARLICASGRDD